MDPRIEIVELDPDGFGWLARVLQRRRRPNWLWILDQPGEPRTDPRTLLDKSGAERVVVIDAGAAAALGGAVAEAAAPQLTQLEWITRAHELFWSSPAVRTAPPPPRPPHFAALERLAAGCDGRCALAEATDDRGGVLLRLVGWFGGGRIVRLSSRLPDGAEPAATIRCTAAELEAALLGEGPLDALSELIDQRIEYS